MCVWLLVNIVHLFNGWEFWQTFFFGGDTWGWAGMLHTGTLFRKREHATWAMPAWGVVVHALKYFLKLNLFLNSRRINLMSCFCSTHSWFCLYNVSFLYVPFHFFFYSFRDITSDVPHILTYDRSSESSLSCQPLLRHRTSVVNIISERLLTCSCIKRRTQSINVLVYLPINLYSNLVVVCFKWLGV